MSEELTVGITCFWTEMIQPEQAGTKMDISELRPTKNSEYLHYVKYGKLKLKNSVCSLFLICNSYWSAP